MTQRLSAASLSPTQAHLGAPAGFAWPISALDWRATEFV